jgi:hypothetical protein
MKILLFHLKAVKTGTHRAKSEPETFWKSGPEPKQIVSASQHCF